MKLEEHTFDLLDAAPDAILLVGLDGEIGYANELAHRLFGFAPMGLIGTSVDALIPEAPRRGHADRRGGYGSNPSRRSMSSRQAQVMGRRLDGSLFPAEVSLSPVGSGDEMTVMAAVRDVTDRIQSDLETMMARLALDSVEDGVFVFDEAGSRITYVNNGARNQTGFTAAELLDMTPFDLVEGLDPERFNGVVARLRSGGLDSYTDTFELCCINDGRRPVEILIHYVESPTRLTGGFFIAISRDISARLDSEKALRSSETAFRAAFDRAPVAMMITDLSDPGLRRVAEVNNAMCEMLGRSESELVGSTVNEITYPDDRVSSAEHAKQAREGFFSVEKRYLDGEGNPVWCAVHATNIESETGLPYRLAHAIDIRERVAAEAERDRRVRFLSALGDVRMHLLSEPAATEVDDKVCRAVESLFPDLTVKIVGVGEPTPESSDGIRHLEVPLLVRGEVERVMVVGGPNLDVDADPDGYAMIEALANEAALGLQLARSRQDRRELFVVEDRERIGRDLHDLVIQRLLAIGMRLQAARGSEGLDERAAETVMSLDETIDVIRETIFRLSSSEAELQTDVQTLVHSFRSDDGPSVSLNLTGDLVSVPTHMADELLPVINELMSNAVRHSGAGTVEVDIEAVAGSELCLRVTDDGAGFLSRRRSGLGLDNIEARAEGLGGRVEIRSVRGEGSTIIWRVPLASDHQADAR